MNKKSLFPITVDTMFNSGCSYRIPIYQRSFAWEEEHILQLIEDIRGNGEGYFLGNLIVYEDKEEKNTFIVIDGQQRLTTLFIIYKAMPKETKMVIKMNLKFEHRTDSEELLKSLDTNDYDNDLNWSEKIVNGHRSVKEILASIKDSELEVFINRLKKAKMLQVSVPGGTNLNHYFEIMNTRGKQLEKIDILKSRLMKNLSEGSKIIFANIWDACSNMNEYVVKNIKKPGIYSEYFIVNEDSFEWTGSNELVERQE